MRTRAWLAFAVAAVSCAALGALFGLVWAQLAPRVDLFIAGDGKAYPQGYQPEGYMTDDGIAALLCVVAGVLVGILAVVILRRRSRDDADAAFRWATLVVIPLGAVGALALWFAGMHVGSFDLRQAVAAAAEGDTLTAPLRLRMPGVLVLWPATSVLVVFAVALVHWITARARDAAAMSSR